MVIDGKLSTGHARALISIEDKEKQIQIFISKYNKAILDKNRVQKELNQIREKKMKEEMKKCTFKPEKKYMTELNIIKRNMKKR